MENAIDIQILSEIGEAVNEMMQKRRGESVHGDLSMILAFLMQAETKLRGAA